MSKNPKSKTAPKDKAVKDVSDVKEQEKRGRKKKVELTTEEKLKLLEDELTANRDELTNLRNEYEQIKNMSVPLIKQETECGIEELIMEIADIQQAIEELKKPVV